MEGVSRDEYLQAAAFWYPGVAAVHIENLDQLDLVLKVVSQGGLSVDGCTAHLAPTPPGGRGGTLLDGLVVLFVHLGRLDITVNLLKIRGTDQYTIAVLGCCCCCLCWQAPDSR